MIAQTSREAYASLQASGAVSPQQAEILSALKRFGPMTREEIHHATGLKLQSVCGRCNELVAAGRVHEHGTKYTPRAVTVLAYTLDCEVSK